MNELNVKHAPNIPCKHSNNRTSCKPRIHPLTIAILGLSMFTQSQNLFADPRDWIGNTGNWDVAGNWFQNAIPGGEDAITVSGSSSVANKLSGSGSLIIGGSGAGSLTISSGATVTNVDNDFSIGFDSNGNLTINSGSQLSITNAIVQIGLLNSGQGQVIINGGSWQQSGNLLSVGTTGSGNISIINAGILQTTNNSIIGTLSNGVGVVTIDGVNSKWTSNGIITLAQNAGSSGTLNIINNGVLETQQLRGLNGNKSVNINNGTLRALDVKADFIQNFTGTEFSIQNNFNIDSNGFDIGITNSVISGTGNLVKLGTGKLTINTTPTYTGMTLINEETLELVGGVSLNASSLVNLTGAGAIFNLSTLGANTTIQNFAGVIGSQVTLGSNSLTAGGASNTEFAGIMSSTGGGFTKNGTGTLTLSGINTYTGDTTVAQGALLINGSITSNATVSSGASLGGIGTINGNLLVNGTIAPGNSIGTLNINGNYTQGAGSIYAVEINAAGQSDIINITGTATIQPNTTVAVTREAGTYVPGTSYIILNADGGVTGTYTTLTQMDAPFLDLVLAYDANHVYLNIVRQNNNNNGNGTGVVTLGAFAQTPNQIAVANTAEVLGVTSPIFLSLLNSPSAVSFRQSLDALSGEIHASKLAVFLEDSRYLRDATLNRMQQAFTSETSPLHKSMQPGLETTTSSLGELWIQGFGAWGSLDGNTNAANVSRNTQGVFIGQDWLFEDASLMGVVGGYSHANFDINQRASSGDSDNYHLGIYGGTQINRWALKAGGAYSWHYVDTKRFVSTPGISNSLTAGYNGGTAQLFAEMGYDLSYNTLGLEPFANVAYVNVDGGKFTEKGGVAALGGQGKQNMTYSTLGLRQGFVLQATERSMFNETILLGWRYAFNDVTPQGRFNFVGTSVPFLIEGAPIAKNSLLIDAGLNYVLPAKNLAFRLAYIGQWASKVQDNGVTGTLTWAFS